MATAMIELQKSFTSYDDAVAWMGWEFDRTFDEFKKVTMEVVMIGGKYRVTIRGEEEL